LANSIVTTGDGKHHLVFSVLYQSALLALKRKYLVFSFLRHNYNSILK